MLSLPKDVLVSLTRYLPPRDAARLARVCRRFRKLFTSRDVLHSYYRSWVSSELRCAVHLTPTLPVVGTMVHYRHTLTQVASSTAINTAVFIHGVNGIEARIRNHKEWKGFCSVSYLRDGRVMHTFQQQRPFLETVVLALMDGGWSLEWQSLCWPVLRVEIEV